LETKGSKEKNGFKKIGWKEKKLLKKWIELKKQEIVTWRNNWSNNGKNFTKRKLRSESTT